MVKACFELYSCRYNNWPMAMVGLYLVLGIGTLAVIVGCLILAIDIEQPEIKHPYELPKDWE